MEREEREVREDRGDTVHSIQYTAYSSQFPGYSELGWANNAKGVCYVKLHASASSSGVCADLRPPYSASTRRRGRRQTKRTSTDREDREDDDKQRGRRQTERTTRDRERMTTHNAL